MRPAHRTPELTEPEAYVAGAQKRRERPWPVALEYRTDLANQQAKNNLFALAMAEALHEFKLQRRKP